MINILLYLDPFSTDNSMSDHRAVVYKKFYNEFNADGVNIKIYASKIFGLKFNELPQSSLILTDLSVWNNANEYCGLAQNNLIHEAYVEKVLLDFKGGEFIPDIIITNSPSCVPRKIWGGAAIFHYELGFFNRSPFPIFHQLDPLGYYHKSMLSQYPWSRIDTEQADIDSLVMLKNNFVNELKIEINKVGSIDAVYVPLPSFNTWSVATENNFKNRVDYLCAVAKKLPNDLLIVNEKPQYPLLEYELEDISKIKNVKLVENSDLNGVGSHLAMLCRSTFTFSPSLSLQCIFWGNQLLCPEGSSMKTWELTDNKFGKLAGYVSRFNFSEFSDSRKIIFNQFSKRSFI